MSGRPSLITPSSFLLIPEKSLVDGLPKVLLLNQAPLEHRLRSKLSIKTRRAHEKEIQRNPQDIAPATESKTGWWFHRLRPN